MLTKSEAGFSYRVYSYKKKACKQLITFFMPIFVIFWARVLKVARTLEAYSWRLSLTRRNDSPFSINICYFKLLHINFYSNLLFCIIQPIHCFIISYGKLDAE